MKKTSVVLLVIAVAMLAGGQIAWAGKAFWANVSADAQCSVLGTDVTVDAGLIQKDAPSSGPIVSKVEFSLEQHFPSPDTNVWDQNEESIVTLTFFRQFDLLAAGERYDVPLQDYLNICTGLVNPAANAVRAVVKITVDNANYTKRTDGNVLRAAASVSPIPAGRETAPSI